MDLPRVAPGSNGGPSPQGRANSFAILQRRDALCLEIEGAIHCTETFDDEPISSRPAEPLEPHISLATGDRFGCYVTPEGLVRCLGANEAGQLGALLPDQSVTNPVTVVGVTHADRVFVESHACARTTSGDLYCWGANRSGETGGDTAYVWGTGVLVSATKVPNLSNVLDVAIGEGTTCATTTAKDTYCWGRAVLEEHRKQRGDQNQVPAKIESLRGVESLVASRNTFCGVLRGGVRCFGGTYFLGKDEFDVPNARKVALGRSHACALSGSGEVYCFGSPDYGVLGLGPGSTARKDTSLVPVSGVANAVDVFAGDTFSCAATKSEDLWCWGSSKRNDTRKVFLPKRVRVRP